MLHEKNCDFSISIDFDRLGACVSKQDADSSCFLEPLMMSSPPHQLETYLSQLLYHFFCDLFKWGPVRGTSLFHKFNEFFRSTRTWRLHLLIVTLHEESELLKHIRCCRWKSFWKGSKLKRPPTIGWFGCFCCQMTPICWCYSWYHVVPLPVFAKPKCWSKKPPATMSCWRCIWSDEMMMNQAKLQAQQQNFQIILSFS